MRKIKFWFYRIRHVRKDLGTLFLIAIISVLLNDLWLVNVPGGLYPFPELWGIFYKICFAYITGFIFYFINVYIESEKNKVKTYKYVHNKVAKVQSLCNTFLGSLNRNSRIPADMAFDSEEEKIKFQCENINPQNEYLIGGFYNITFPNWFEAIEFIEKENKELTGDLLFVRDFVKSDIVVILTDIEEGITNAINITHGRPMANKSLKAFAAGILQYKELCDKLGKTFREQYKNYQKEYHENFLKKRKN